MSSVLSPLAGVPVQISGVPSGEGDAASLLALHREVLETMRLTIASGAHPSCGFCHNLAAVLDRYLIG